mgnify:CR=1 FL=1|tara:strand:+ start:4311 stop:4775 length:465 start_codon:yes stop_codon:yes gene_type:complete
MDFSGLKLKLPLILVRTKKFVFLSALIFVSSCINSGPNLNSIGPKKESTTTQKPFRMDKHIYPPNTKLDFSKKVNFKISPSPKIQNQATSLAIYGDGKSSPYIATKNISAFVGQTIPVKVSPGSDKVIVEINNSQLSLKKIFKIHNKNLIEIEL